MFETITIKITLGEEMPYLNTIKIAESPDNQVFNSLSLANWAKRNERNNSIPNRQYTNNLIEKHSYKILS